MIFARSQRFHQIWMGSWENRYEKTEKYWHSDKGVVGVCARAQANQCWWMCVDYQTKIFINNGPIKTAHWQRVCYTETRREWEYESAFITPRAVVSLFIAYY